MAEALREQDLVARLGARDAGGVPVPPTITRFETLDGFWIHLDVDILDATIMPAVDTPTPEG